MREVLADSKFCLRHGDKNPCPEEMDSTVTHINYRVRREQEGVRKEEAHGTFWTGSEGGMLWGGECVTAIPALSRSVWVPPPPVSLHSK